MKGSVYVSFLQYYAMLMIVESVCVRLRACVRACMCAFVCVAEDCACVSACVRSCEYV